MSDLFAPVVSIARTQRGRFYWAAWWSAPPNHHPFRAPDAADGGARTREIARSEAERAAGRSLIEIEPAWARACIRSMRGQPPFSAAELNRAASGEAPLPKARSRNAAPSSAWAVLGVEAHADALEIKRAFRRRALETHPDHGGDAATFRVVKAAYDKAMSRQEKGRRRPRRR